MDASFILTKFTSIVIVKSEKEEERGETKNERVWGKRKENAGNNY